MELKASCNGHGLELAVRDTGPGIGRRRCRTCSSRSSAATSRTGRMPGTWGWGLFLVKSHLHALNGRCTVESRPGEGSTFRVRVPIEGATA